MPFSADLNFKCSKRRTIFRDNPSKASGLICGASIKKFARFVVSERTMSCLSLKRANDEGVSFNKDCCIDNCSEFIRVDVHTRLRGQLHEGGQLSTDNGYDAALYLNIPLHFQPRILRCFKKFTRFHSWTETKSTKERTPFTSVFLAFW